MLPDERKKLAVTWLFFPESGQLSLQRRIFPFLCSRGHPQNNIIMSNVCLTVWVIHLVKSVEQGWGMWNWGMCSPKGKSSVGGSPLEILPSKGRDSRPLSLQYSGFFWVSSESVYRLTWATCIHIAILSNLSVLSITNQFFVTPWIVTHQAPLSMGFSRREYWSGLPFPFPGDLPGFQTQVSCIAGRYFTVWATREVRHTNL